MAELKNKLYVKTEDEEKKHPWCVHGPTLLFYNKNDEYYSCSAFREKRDCNFYLPVKQLTEKALQRRPLAPVETFRERRAKVLNIDNKPKFYCHNCNEVLLSTTMESHDKSHEVIKIKKSQQADPTMFLKPLQNDKAQAQYFFDEKALSFFGSCLVDLGINKVICMGAPRLHSYLQNSSSLNVQSYLLDLDHRFYYFYNDNQFAWYNMCNNHFFDESQKLEFSSFLRNNTPNDRILIFTDPPFGVRTEPVAHTLRKLTYLYNNINSLPHQPLSIFWIFPYYSATYIQNEMPELEMSDYKINYTNHSAYSDNGSKENRKLGSPVRIFTNVPLYLLKLPIEEGYKYCAACECYTALENRHCMLCNKCPSKNGSTYKHCKQCGTCVKPSYQHCINCRRCVQIEGHNCIEYQLNQRCWICFEVGHIERNCSKWQKSCKKFVLTAIEAKNETAIRCLLCNRLGEHNERNCPMRNNFIQESTFLGETIRHFS